MDIEIQSENLEHTKNVRMRLIAEHTGQPVERVGRHAVRDRWYTAEQAGTTASSTRTSPTSRP